MPLILALPVPEVAAYLTLLIFWVIICCPPGCSWSLSSKSWANLVISLSLSTPASTIELLQINYML